MQRVSPSVNDAELRFRIFAQHPLKRRPRIPSEHNIFAFEQDFQRFVDEVIFSADFFNCSGEQRPLLLGRGLGHKDDEARMEGLSSIQTPKISGVMGDEDEIALKDPRDQVVILGRGQAEEVDVMGFVARCVPDLGE
jgi:hypothetical protein